MNRQTKLQDQIVKRLAEYMAQYGLDDVGPIIMRAGVRAMRQKQGEDVKEPTTRPDRTKRKRAAKGRQ